MRLHILIKWPFSTGADNPRPVFLQNFVRYPLSPSLVVFFSSERFLLNVERVAKKCLQTGTISAKRWVNMNEFLRRGVGLTRIL